MEFSSNYDKKAMYTPGQSYINQNLTSFPPFNELSRYASLSFANNPITSLETLPSLPSLKALNLNGTEIESFYGAAVQPSLEKLYIKNTPLNYFHDARIMCIAVFGPSLKIINNDPLTTYEVKMGNCFYNSLNSYLKKGWIISGFYPVKLVNLRTHERRIVDVRLPVINLRTFAGISNYEPKYSITPCLPDLLNATSNNSDSFRYKGPLRTRRKCTLNTSYIEPIPSYLPKEIGNISSMTPEELKKAVKKCLCIKDKKKEEEEEKTTSKKKSASFRKKKQNRRFYDNPETMFLHDQENIEDNGFHYLKLDNYEKDIEEIPLPENTHNESELNSKPKGNMQKYFDQLNALGSMEKPSDFIYKNIPASSTSSTYSFSPSSSASSFINDDNLEKQLKEISLRIPDFDSSDLSSMSDSNFDSSFSSSFSSGVDDFMSPSKVKKKQSKKTNES